MALTKSYLTPKISCRYLDPMTRKRTRFCRSNKLSWDRAGKGRVCSRVASAGDLIHVVCGWSWLVDIIQPLLRTHGIFLYRDSFIYTPGNGMIDFQNDRVTQCSCTKWPAVVPRPLFAFFASFITITPYSVYTSQGTKYYSLAENQEAARARISTDRLFLDCKTIKCSKGFFLHSWLFIQGYLHVCINNRSRVIHEGSPIGNVAWWQKKNCQSISPASFLQGCWHDNMLQSLSSPAMDVLSHNSIAHCPSCPVSKYRVLLRTEGSFFSCSRDPIHDVQTNASSRSLEVAWKLGMYLGGMYGVWYNTPLCR